MDAPPSSSPTSTKHRAHVFARLDQARLTLAASLGELLTEGLATPAQLIDAIGFEDLERHLSPAQRARVMAAALEAGRRGAAFEDVALFNVVTPDAIALALPLGRLQEVLESFCHHPEVMEQLDDADLAPTSLRAGVRSSRPAPDSEEVDPDAVELLPPSMPSPVFVDSPTKTSGDD